MDEVLVMSAKSKKEARDIENVSIPSDVYNAVASVLDPLTLQIIESAAQIASERGSDSSGRVRVSFQDAMQAAKSILSDTQHRFERVLAQEEARHARIASESAA